MGPEVPRKRGNARGGKGPTVGRAGWGNEGRRVEAGSPLPETRPGSEDKPVHESCTRFMPRAELMRPPAEEPDAGNPRVRFREGERGAIPSPYSNMIDSSGFRPRQSLRDRRPREFKTGAEHGTNPASPSSCFLVSTENLCRGQGVLSETPSFRRHSLFRSTTYPCSGWVTMSNPG